MSARSLIRRPGRQAEPLFFIAILGIIALVLVTGVKFARSWYRQAIDAAEREESIDKVRQIAVALYSYHDTYGELPPPFVTDEYGDPMHSWRALLLPFLETRGLHNRYDFSEPWDGPNNRLLMSERPDVFADPRLPADDGKRTSYQAIVGAGTIFDPAASDRSFNSVTDGVMGTVLVIENCAEPVIWTQPDDTSPEDFLAGKAIGDVPDGEAIMSMADGLVSTYRKSDLPQAKRWITRAGGD